MKRQLALSDWLVRAGVGSVAPKKEEVEAQMIGSGWGQGAGALLLLYTGLLVLGIATHLIWSYRTGRTVWRSGRALLPKVMLIGLAVATPIVGFYASILIQHVRQRQPHPAKRLRTLIMPAAGLCAVMACAVEANLRYSQEYRSWSNVIGFLPGFLALYVVMQAIIHMAASVFGLTRNGVFASRTHLVSVGLLLLVTFVPVS
jgi:hypothetical protein